MNGLLEKAVGAAMDRGCDICLATTSGVFKEIWRGFSASLLDTEIHEVLEKPALYES